MTRDLRRYARQTKIRIMLGFILLLFLVGDGLILLFYGRDAALMGLFCLLLGLAPVVLIGLILWVLDWIVHSVSEE